MGKPSKPTIRKLRSARLATLAGCAGAMLLASPGLADEQKARTSDEASQANLQGALLAPLRDINVVRDEVPNALNGAKEAPYLNPQDASCAELAAMIAPLDKVLGPDVGDGAKRPEPDAGDMLFGAMADVTRDVIPFRGVVRRITGASKHDREVKAAREAGQLRRAYLKGFASANGCYGPPDQRVAAQTRAAPEPEPAPPVRLAASPPIRTAALEPPAAVQPTPEPPAPPSPRFNLPESWRSQLALSRTSY